jgi:hypothetical protein
MKTAELFTEICESFIELDEVNADDHKAQFRVYKGPASLNTHLSQTIINAKASDGEHGLWMTAQRQMAPAELRISLNNLTDVTSLIGFLSIRYRTETQPNKLVEVVYDWYLGDRRADSSDIAFADYLGLADPLADQESAEGHGFADAEFIANLPTMALRAQEFSG